MKRCRNFRKSFNDVLIHGRHGMNYVIYLHQDTTVVRSYRCQGCARLRFLGLTRLRLMLQPRYFNSDSTQQFAFLD